MLNDKIFIKMKTLVEQFNYKILKKVPPRYILNEEYFKKGEVPNYYIFAIFQGDKVKLIKIAKNHFNVIKFLSSPKSRIINTISAKFEPIDLSDIEFKVFKSSIFDNNSQLEEVNNEIN